MILTTLLVLTVTANAQDSAVDFLKKAREGMKGVPEVRVQEEAQEKNLWESEDGWPVIPPYDKDGKDVVGLNRHLAARGVGARIYQVDASQTEGVPRLEQTYLAVWRKGGFSLVPFADPKQTGWHQLVGLEVMGKGILATKNEHGIAYFDLSQEPMTVAEGASVARRVGVYLYNPPGGRNHVNWVVSRTALNDMLGKAKFGVDSRKLIMARVDGLLNNGLKKGAMIGADQVLVDVPPRTEFSIDGTTPPGSDEKKTLVMNLGHKLTIIIWPDFKIGN